MTDFLQMHIQKLNDLLIQPGEWDEGRAALFLLSYRKVIEEINDYIEQGKYSLSKFYCDWAFHTRKNRITDDMKIILEKVDKGMPLDIKTNQFAALKIQDNTNFIYFDHLRQELKLFLVEYSLSTDIVDDHDKWIDFLKPLRRLFIEQPIINATPTMLSFRLLPSAPDAVIWVIEFSDQRGLVKFGNAD